MQIQNRLRIIHRKLAPWLLPFLFLSAISGITYRVGRSWFDFTEETGGVVLIFHTGEWFGMHGSVVYVILLGLGLLFLVISGLWMWKTSQSPKNKTKKSHRIIAVMLSLPLIITAVTGIAYQVGGKWLHADEKTLKLIMNLHQGSWLGPDLRLFYIILIGGGLIVLCITGLRMCLQMRSKKN